MFFAATSSKSNTLMASFGEEISFSRVRGPHSIGSGSSEGLSAAMAARSEPASSGLAAQRLEHALDARLSEGPEAPEIGPAHADRLGAHAQRLDHVGAAAEAGIDQDRHRAGNLNDLRQRLDRRPSAILAAAAVVRH